MYWNAIFGTLVESFDAFWMSLGPVPRFRPVRRLHLGPAVGQSLFHRFPTARALELSQGVSEVKNEQRCVFGV